MNTGGAKARSWMIGIAFLSVVVLLAAYFLFIAPELTEASERNDEAQSQEDVNARSTIEVAALRKQFAEIDSYREELAALRQQVPTTSEHAEFQRQLAALAENHDVTVLSITVQASTPIEIRVPEPEQPAESDDDAEAEEPTPGTSKTDDELEEGKKPGSLIFTGLYAIPLNFDVRGEYHDVLNLIQELQTSSKRLFAVRTLDGSAVLRDGGDDPASAKAGQLEMSIDGRLFVLLDPDAPNIAPLSEEEAAEPLVLPKPAKGSNPLSTEN